MKIGSVILISILLTGCASTTVIDHDFGAVVDYYENQYGLDVNSREKVQVFPKQDKPDEQILNFLTGGMHSYSAQIKTYKQNRKLKLKVSSDFWDGIILSSGTVITITPENPTQSKIKVRSVDSLLFIPFSQHDVEDAYIDSLIAGLNEK